MRLNIFISLIGLAVLLPCGIVMWVAGTGRPWLFYGAELWSVIVVVLLALFYLRAVRPVEKLAEGMDILKSGEWNVRLRKLGQPEVDSISQLFNLMLERLQSQQRQIEEKTHFLTTLSEEAPIGIIVTDIEGNIALCNPYGCAQLGFTSESNLLHRPISELAGRLPEVLNSMSDGADITLKLNARDIKRISRRHFTDCGIRHSFYIIADLTDVVAAAEREGYEKLVRTISHEVNNSAGVIATALDSFALDADDAELARSCRDRALAMSKFVGAYAGVVKTSHPNLVKTDLVEMLQSLKPFLESLCKRYQCSLAVTTPLGAACVMLDPVQIEQVLVNVLKNACEASVAGDEVRIECGKTGFCIINNGILNPDVEDHIFSPFFTTKPTGQGIGLTLAREILERHNATYGLHSENGKTFFSAIFEAPNSKGLHHHTNQR